MTKTDRELGMDRSITRRDFLNGVGVTVGAALLPPDVAETSRRTGEVEALQPPRAVPGEIYPPALTGMRGSGPGSMDVAHAMRDGKTWETGEDTGEFYDLIVVGAGLSGLAAAYFFRKKTVPEAKILILDNHDDFGGHARRNEFTVGGRTLIVRGGTAAIERPATYTAEGRDLLTEIGVNLFDPTYKVDTNLYRSLGLRLSMYFDTETFGVDRLVINQPASGHDEWTKASSDDPFYDHDSHMWRDLMARDFLASTPLPDQVKADLARLWNDKSDYLAGMSVEEKVRKLKKISYKDYLIDVVKVHPDLLKCYHPLGAPAALTTDTTSSWWAFNWNYPGFDGLGLEQAPDSVGNLHRTRLHKTEPIEFSFPEGNAGVARLLIRSLIPAALPGRSMADAETRRVRYERLDEPSSPVKLRLSSTVVRVDNNKADPSASNEVEVVYVYKDRAHKVRGKGCVLACYNSAIPFMVPELPEKQKEALHKSVRAVMMITNVAIRNWASFQKLGVSEICSPGTSYPGYAGTELMAPVSLGAYEGVRSPLDPTVVNLRGGIDFKYRPGMTARDMFRSTRAALYETSFETFERRIRTHLARILGLGGFDPARDIEAITINRWGHGYAMGMNLLFDPDWSEDEYPWVIGRKRFGRITIANSDAEGVPQTQAAFDQAHRAVDELLTRQFGWWNRV